MVRAKLAQRGIPGDIADKSIAPLQDSETQADAARHLLTKWNRRSMPTDPQKRRVAAAGFLARKGFDSEIVWRIVGEILGRPGDNDGTE